MTMRIRPVALLWLMPVLGLTGLANAAAPLSTADAFFEANVRPLLAARCFKCHGRGDTLKGGLNLTSRAGVLAGGERGPAARPGKPANSRLIQAVRHDGDLTMPPGKKLTDKEIEILARWVRMALPWPDADANTSSDAVGTGLWSLKPLKSVARLAVVHREVAGTAREPGPFRRPRSGRGPKPDVHRRNRAAHPASAPS